MSYRECIYCNASLDHNELCDCPESSKKRAAPEVATPKAARKNNPFGFYMRMSRDVKTLPGTS